MTLPPTFAALRHRNFRLFYIGQLISLIGSWMQNTAQGWLVVLLATPGASFVAVSGGDVHAEGVANFWLGVIATAGSLPILLGSLYGGVVADRYPKRTIIVIAQTAQMLIALGLAFLVWHGVVQIWHVVVAALLLGITNVFDIPARQSFVYEMVGREDLPNAIALNSSIFNAARAFGPALAGLLIVLVRGKSQEAALAQSFFYNGLSYIAVIVGLLMMRNLLQGGVVNNETPIAQFKQTFAYLGTHEAMRVLVTLVAVYSVSISPFFVLLPSLARFTLHLDAREYGLLMSCQGLGALAGALTMATLSGLPHKGRILTASVFGFPLLLATLAFTTNYIIASTLVVGIGFLIITFLATANTLLQTSAPDQLRGRLMGVYSLILIGLTPIGSLFAGLVANSAGAPIAIASGALLIFVFALWTTLRFPTLRRVTQTLPDNG